MTAVKKVMFATVVAAFAAFIGHRFLKVNDLINKTSTNILHAVFSTQGLKYPGLPSFSNEPGKIYVLDLLHPKATPVELQIKGELDLSSFNPHGISVYTDETDDSVYLFTVNHPQHKSQVEIFRFVEENTLVHLKTITHPLLHSVNDIVAVGVESFYATNDHSTPNEALHFLTILLGLPWCDVVYFSQEEVRVAAKGFLSSNGINSVGVGSLCDNIEVDHRTGDIWLGCHPNAMKLSKYDPEDPPDSEVLQIKNIHSQQPVVSQVYADNGNVIMGSSVAASYERKLLIGTVFQKALLCDLK
ncbi:hypothetical protein PAMP_003276 [Pampus punctatissimus]